MGKIRLLIGLNSPIVMRSPIVKSIFFIIDAH